MRILDRYVLSSMLKVFTTCILVFLLLTVIMDLFSHLDEIFKQKVGFDLLVLYYLNFLPIIFVRIAPFAVLLGCLYSLGVLNRNNEIIAMRTAGLSIFQINRTLIIFASLTSILVFLVNDKFVPQSEITKQILKTQMSQEDSENAEPEKTVKNLSIYGLKNRLFFINKFIVSKNTLEGITILEQDNLANLRKKIVASKGTYKDGLWYFYECITYFFNKDGRLKGEPVYVPEQLMDITETPSSFLKQQQRPEFMSISQLNDYILKLSRSSIKIVGKNLISLEVDFASRFFMPLTSLVILFVGIPFSLVMRRNANALFSFGIALLLGGLYYFVDAFSIAFGKAGLIPPVLSAGLAHLLFLGLGLYLIQKAS